MRYAVHIEQDFTVGLESGTQDDAERLAYRILGKHWTLGGLDEKGHKWGAVEAGIKVSVKEIAETGLDSYAGLERQKIETIKTVSIDSVQQEIF